MGIKLINFLSIIFRKFGGILRAKILPCDRSKSKLCCWINRRNFGRYFVINKHLFIYLNSNRHTFFSFIHCMRQELKYSTKYIMIKMIVVSDKGRGNGNCKKQRNLKRGYHTKVKIFFKKRKKKESQKWKDTNYNFNQRK